MNYTFKSVQWFMFFVLRCVFMFKFFCVCFWWTRWRTMGENTTCWYCVCCPFSCYCDIGTVLFENADHRKGHSSSDYLRRGRTRWREEGGAESTEIYWIWSNQETVGMWCQNGLYANLVAKGELCWKWWFCILMIAVDRKWYRSLICILVALLCVDDDVTHSLTFSLSLSLQSPSHSLCLFWFLSVPMDHTVCCYWRF